MALTRPTQKQFTSDIIRFDNPVFAANYAHTGTNVNDVGFIFNRGSDINVGFIWDESADEFAAIITTDTGDTTGNIAISSYATFKVGQIVANGIAFPASDGTAGQVLITNGSGTLSFTDQSGAAGGSNAQVQFNDTGALGGSANLTFDGTTLTVSGALAVDNVSIDGNQISASAGNLSITSTGSVTLLTDGSERMRIDSSGHVTPGANNAQDLGTSSLRWRNIYTNDLHLSNGIGDYTIVEGEEDLFLYNNKTGKVFKFALIEVDPNDAVKKANTK